MIKWVSASVKKMESHVSQNWYPFALGALAFIDYFLLLVPMVGVLITSVLAAPKRWLVLAFSLVIGSVLGVGLFSWLISTQGLTLLHSIAPHITEGSLWKHSEAWANDYGLWALFTISVLPVADHPMIALISLTEAKLSSIVLIALLGKTIKYFLISWLGSHMPGTLLKFTKKSILPEELIENIKKPKP